jgi:hypothetical protein
MVSSTFTNLQNHRAALIDAIGAHNLHPNVMENDSARLVDVIDSSLEMVRDSAAYIGVISLKYGEIPECPVRNPDNLSLTELEFNEAQRLDRPILLFIMGDKHPVTKADIERDVEKEKKLDAFRERAKKKSPDGSVNRVYAVFNSLEEFKDELGPSLAELSQYLDSANTDARDNDSPPVKDTAIPKPPAFYAKPDYIGSHRFVGRAAELQTLNDWAMPADPTNVLIFEAIGGNGKSMLTWQWAKFHSIIARTDWAGRFWYSLYEKGAVMADFCQRALAYMTGRPLEKFAKRNTAQLKDELLDQLHSKPWLIIIDGLERALVAYHRIDAAEVPDEEVNVPTDKIGNRNPRDAIRDEDNDLLRALAVAAPSKILISSRLTPRVLLNPSGQTIPGAKRINLPGLRPPDAERLLRSCGIERDIEGDSAAIQSYLTANCDNHPLVIGVLGGIINNYLENRGNFDAWLADPHAGGELDLAKLDLIQRRNHILRVALDALSPESKQLLSMLALITDSLDSHTLKALNPFLPPEPDEVLKPQPPEEDPIWWVLSDERKAQRQKQYQAELVRWQDYEKAVSARLASAEFRAAPKKLEAAVSDLEQRGLLQWDERERKYNLHPVVRSIAAGWMQAEDAERYGMRVVDHFSAVSHSPYEQAKTLEDLRPGLTVVRMLLKLGRFQQAYNAYKGDLDTALKTNLRAETEVLSLLRPFYPNGWMALPIGVKQIDITDLANSAAGALFAIDELEASQSLVEAAMLTDLRNENWVGVITRLLNLGLTYGEQDRLAKEDYCMSCSLEVALLTDSKVDHFRSRLAHFRVLAEIGQSERAEALWRELDSMGRDWSRHEYVPGDAEWKYAEFLFWNGKLSESHLEKTERLAIAGKYHLAIKNVQHLRGIWQLAQGNWSQAAVSLAESLRMARESGIADAFAETGLALAKHHLGQLADPRDEAARLAQFRNPAHRYLAQLWLALGDQEKARHHALASYRSAWGDGEPYVRRYELARTTELLQQMQVPIPNLPPYNPDKDAPIPWAAEVRAAINKLRDEKQAN